MIWIDRFASLAEVLVVVLEPVDVCVGCWLRCLFQSMTGSFTKGSNTDSRVSRLSRRIPIHDRIPVVNMPSEPAGPNASTMFGVNRNGTTSGRGRFKPLSKILQWNIDQERIHLQTTIEVRPLATYIPNTEHWHQIQLQKPTNQSPHEEARPSQYPSICFQHDGLQVRSHGQSLTRPQH